MQPCDSFSFCPLADLLSIDLLHRITTCMSRDSMKSGFTIQVFRGWCGTSSPIWAASLKTPVPWAHRSRTSSGRRSSPSIRPWTAATQRSKLHRERRKAAHVGGLFHLSEIWIIAAMRLIFASGAVLWLLILFYAHLSTHIP